MPPALRSARTKAGAVPARPMMTTCGLALAICSAAGPTSMLVVLGVLAITAGSSLALASEALNPASTDCPSGSFEYTMPMRDWPSTAAVAISLSTSWS